MIYDVFIHLFVDGKRNYKSLASGSLMTMDNVPLLKNTQRTVAFVRNNVYCDKPHIFGDLFATEASFTDTFVYLI